MYKQPSILPNNIEITRALSPAQGFPAILGLPFKQLIRGNGGPDVRVVLQIGLDACILV